MVSLGHPLFHHSSKHCSVMRTGRSSRSTEITLHPRWREVKRYRILTATHTLGYSMLNHMQSRAIITQSHKEINR